MTTKPARIRALFDQLCKEPWKRFPNEGRRIEASNLRGVYVIAQGQIVLHVGSTPRGKNGINQRLRDHLARKSSFVKGWFGEDREKVRECSYRYLIVVDPRERSLLEHFAIGSLCPMHVG